MDLKSALKKNKPIRRESVGGRWFYPEELDSLTFDAAEICANDWEIEKKSVYLTEETFEVILKQSNNNICKLKELIFGNRRAY